MTRICRILLKAGVATTALIAMPVAAQTSSAAAKPDKVQKSKKLKKAREAVRAEPAADGAVADTNDQEILVTGTRILRPNMESNAPITVIDEAFLKERGLARIEDALSQIPQITPMLGLQGNSWTAGRAGINLRRLGQGRTLTLLNGQRLDNDVGLVPGALIERIDVLTGGASAVYGSDAIAGVVNFILKRRFNGLVLDAEASGFQHHNDNMTLLKAGKEAGYPSPNERFFGGGNFYASLAGGQDLFDKKVNVSAFLTYKEAKPVRFSDIDQTTCPLMMNPLNTEVFRNDTYVCNGTTFNQYNYFNVGGVDYANARDGSRSWRPYSTDDEVRVPRNDFIQRADRTINAGMFVSADLMADLKFNGNFMVSRTRQNAEIAVTDAFYTGDVRINCDNPFLGAQQAAILCGSAAGTTALADASTVVAWKDQFTQVMAPRIWNWRASGAVSGTVVDSIRFEASYLRTRDIFRNSTTNTYTGDVDKFARSLQARNVNGVPTCLSKIDGTDPDCVPANAFQPNSLSDETFGYLTGTGRSWQQNDLTVMMGVLSGTLGEYGIKSPFADSGIGFALVGEQRNVRSQSRGSGVWSSWTQFDGRARVRELAGEIDIPLIQGKPFFQELSINGGYRVSDYTTYEKLVHTWKAESTWAPVDGLRFRGSYNRAVRVPVLERLEGENRYPNVGTLDLCSPPRAPTSGQALQRYTFDQCSIGMTRAQYDALTSNSTCDANGFCRATLINGGNPDLKPERGRSYTAGVVIQPTSIPGFSATVDWYNIAITGAFEWSRWGMAFDQCYNEKINFWCNIYKRDPQTGRVTEIDARYSNSGRTESQGFDFSLGYNIDPRRLGIADNAGTFAVNFSGTLATRLTRQFAPNTPTWQCNGYHGFNCGEPSPKWRHVTGINWALPWVKGGVGLTWRYTGSTKISKLSKDTTLAARPTPTNPDVYPLIARLPAYSYFDFAANVAVNRYLDLRFNMQNLFDKDPPLIGDGPFGGVGQYQNTYSSYYTIRGRTLRVGLTARF
ncbi:TonB-dependent receptor domain-containing protein [Sphingomonas sp. Leaf343]|uniref:TonB-dependent receptor domain-containing protein n=1 Tax=Sphingomonas sp. Leaf343 TaxID=1736345 RepID=UPI0006FE1DAC|nr:TonB-dependent receptor [Sphingomonas sp. Leaf343]KQR82104.1 hypothetical protein ASG07_10370 [Sphingomonas sp. Leaf343]